MVRLAFAVVVCFECLLFCEEIDLCILCVPCARTNGVGIFRSNVTRDLIRLLTDRRYMPFLPLNQTLAQSLLCLQALDGMPSSLKKIMSVPLLLYQQQQ